MTVLVEQHAVLAVILDRDNSQIFLHQPEGTSVWALPGQFYWGGYGSDQEFLAEIVFQQIGMRIKVGCPLESSDPNIRLFLCEQTCQSTDVREGFFASLETFLSGTQKSAGKGFYRTILDGFSLLRHRLTTFTDSYCDPEPDEICPVRLGSNYLFQVTGQSEVSVWRRIDPSQPHGFME